MVKRIFGILGWLGTALVVAAVGVRFYKPELERVWNNLALAGLVCVVLYLVSQWREIAGAFSARSARYGTLSVASVFLVLGILIGINYIANRENKRWDLTAGGEFTLSDQTRRLLSGLKEPIRLLVFDRSDGFQRFHDRLDAYTYASPQVKVEYIDVDKNPSQAKEYEVQQYGTVVVEFKDRKERITSDLEQEISNGIIKAVEGQQKKVYFAQGHGEKDPTSADERAGYNNVATALGHDNFTVNKLVIAQQGKVPPDASVVVIAGPTADYLPPEIEALRQYLDHGGKVLFLLDPPEGSSQPTPNLSALLKEWDFEVGNNVVVDVSGVGQLLGAGPSMPVAANYPNHDITQRFNVLTAYPVARSVTAILPAENGRFAQNFIETGPQSWAEADLKALASGGQVSLDESKGDKKGPITIGAALTIEAPVQPTAPAPKPEAGAEAPEKPVKVMTRVAVVGDSDFAANGFVGISGNRDMFLNIVNWLAEQETLISIRPKEAQDRRVTLTAERQRFTFYLTVLGIPLMVMMAGVATWWRRR